MSINEWVTQKAMQQRGEDSSFKGIYEDNTYIQLFAWIHTHMHTHT